MAASNRIKKIDNTLVITTDESPLQIQNIELSNFPFIDFYFSTTFEGQEEASENLVLFQPSSTFKLDFWKNSSISDGYGRVISLYSDTQGITINCLVFTDTEACDYLRQILAGITP